MATPLGRGRRLGFAVSMSRYGNVSKKRHFVGKHGFASLRLISRRRTDCPLHQTSTARTFEREIAAIHRTAEAYKDSIKKGRDSKFRSEVLLNYRFTCAFTGYSLNTTKENMVEAAHIHQHALSGDDDPRNGLALTPDAHWMFDRGLWTAEPRGDGFIVIVATDHFKDSSPYGRSLYNHHEKPLFFPKEPH